MGCGRWGEIMVDGTRDTVVPRAGEMSLAILLALEMGVGDVVFCDWLLAGLFRTLLSE